MKSVFYTSDRVIRHLAGLGRSPIIRPRRSARARRACQLFPSPRPHAYIVPLFCWTIEYLLNCTGCSICSNRRCRYMNVVYRFASHLCHKNRAHTLYNRDKKHDMTCRKLGLTAPSDRNASAIIGAISRASRVTNQTDVTFTSRLTSSLINLLKQVFPTSVHHRTSTPSRYSGSGFHRIFTPVKLTVIHSHIMISFVHTEPHPPQTDTT